MWNTENCVRLNLTPIWAATKCLCWVVCARNEVLLCLKDWTLMALWSLNVYCRTLSRTLTRSHKKKGAEDRLTGFISYFFPLDFANLFSRANHFGFSAYLVSSGGERREENGWNNWTWQHKASQISIESLIRSISGVVFRFVYFRKG